jgi:hypothetical protein
MRGWSDWSVRNDFRQATVGSLQKAAGLRSMSITTDPSDAERQATEPQPALEQKGLRQHPCTNNVPELSHRGLLPKHLSGFNGLTLGFDLGIPPTHDAYIT